MIYTNIFSVAILLGLIKFSFIEAICNPNIDKNCKHKKTTKTTSISSITDSNLLSTATISKECKDVECEKSGKFCLCTNFNNSSHSTHWPVPNTDTCPSIGCSMAGKNCYCYSTECNCNDEFIQCDKKECALSDGCYCYFGDRAITTKMPDTKNCSDLLREIGDNNGRYQCSPILCKCDQYGDCVCIPQKIKKLQTETTERCDSEKCQKQSFEYCECEYWNCTGKSCIQSIVFKKLPKSGICSGILNSIECKNVGQKCICEEEHTENCSKTDYKRGNIKKSECACVDVDPLEVGDCGYCESSGYCICTYGEFAVTIAKTDNCKALERSKGNDTKKFDACPYLVDSVCKCERNPNNGEKQCFCRSPSKRVPPFNVRPDPYIFCNEDSECIEHNELYCYCTNYVNNTYVKKVSRSAIAMLPKKEFDKNGVEKLCYVYGHPPDTSCYTFGYQANCERGFCRLTPISLYNS